LDKVEGAVMVLPDDPQEVSASEQAKTAVIAGKVERRCVAGTFRIAGTAVVAVPKSHCLQDAYQNRRRHQKNSLP